MALSSFSLGQQSASIECNNTSPARGIIENFQLIIVHSNCFQNCTSNLLQKRERFLNYQLHDCTCRGKYVTTIAEQKIIINALLGRHLLHSIPCQDPPRSIIRQSLRLLWSSGHPGCAGDADKTSNVTRAFFSLFFPWPSHTFAVP
jgi:hypothetical protein